MSGREPSSRMSRIAEGRRSSGDFWLSSTPAALLFHWLADPVHLLAVRSCQVHELRPSSTGHGERGRSQSTLDPSGLITTILPSTRWVEGCGACASLAAPAYDTKLWHPPSHPRTQRRPTRAIPARDVVRTHAPRRRDVPSLRREASATRRDPRPGVRAPGAGRDGAVGRGVSAVPGAGSARGGTYGRSPRAAQAVRTGLAKRVLGRRLAEREPGTDGQVTGRPRWSTIRACSSGRR